MQNSVGFNEIGQSAARSLMGPMRKLSLKIIFLLSGEDIDIGCWIFFIRQHHCIISETASNHSRVNKYENCLVVFFFFKLHSLSNAGENNTFCVRGAKRLLPQDLLHIWLMRIILQCAQSEVLIA